MGLNKYTFDQILGGRAPVAPPSKSATGSRTCLRRGINGGCFFEMLTYVWVHEQIEKVTTPWCALYIKMILSDNELI